MPELFIELRSEEIPARMQKRASDDLCRLVTDGLTAAGLEFGDTETLATPRRIALSVAGLAKTTPDIKEERKGPRTDAPQKAIEGFLKSAGVSLNDCEVIESKKGSFYLAHIAKPGRPTPDVIAELVPDVINKFPWPKSMRWGTGSLRWVRPLQSIITTFGGKVVPFEVGTLIPGNKTVGHRFMSKGDVRVKGLKDYKYNLHLANVVVDPLERSDTIRSDANKLARRHKLQLVEDEALIHETAGLVEWPVVLIGSFDKAFLDVPPEVIIASIKTHQKCFATRDKAGDLASRYLMVSNLLATDGGKNIIEGNNRVIAARLADAKFFWDLDKKRSLEERLPELEAITFHAKLGNQRKRVSRIEKLAGEIARVIGADPQKAELAARLCKSDLVTGMVGEFPELQGIMGGHYARAEGLDEDVAHAIAEHYKPQGPSDSVPEGKVAQAVALADKIDTLLGFWAIDEKPTGSKDPYALRRAALGVIRILLECELRFLLVDGLVPAHSRIIASGLAEAQSCGETGTWRSHPVPASLLELLGFFADRLKVHLRDQGARHDLIDAVFSHGDQDDLLIIVKRVNALGNFLETEDGTNLLAGVKRATNILRIEEKNEAEKPATRRADMTGKPEANLLVQSEERELNRAVSAAVVNARKAVSDENFEAAMHSLAKLRGPVDAFFDKVTVNADNPNFRENRLRLLNMIRAATLEVADFSRIEG
ncbi:MAG: glycine--tRNA ligase subunit beta [Hyphomicrobiales bacterium]|nr:glycine--tRNA ligase subunit beta [Hyphomicrobiales bacterium]